VSVLNWIAASPAPKTARFNMVLSPKARLAGCLALAPFMLAIWFAVVSREGRTVHASPAGRTIQLGTAQAGAAYAVTISIKNPAQVQGIDAVHATVSDAQGELESKWLHAEDLDFY